MIRHACSPFGRRPTMPEKQADALRMGIRDLLVLELTLGGEIHAHRERGGWRWAFRSIWRPEVIEIPESLLKFYIRRNFAWSCQWSGPAEVQAVVDATKFMFFHPQYRPGESGRLFPHFWTGEFFPPYRGPHEILFQPDERTEHKRLLPGRGTATATTLAG